MAISSKLVLVAVLIVAGLYFVIDHTPPLPLNHEAVGLGTNHMMHNVFGVVLFVIAGLIWWRGKKKK
mgnify:CR=1 FL=1